MLIVVTKSFILKVTGLLFLTLKGIDKFRVSNIAFSSVWVSLAAFRQAFTYSKSTIETIKQRVKYVEK